MSRIKIIQAAEAVFSEHGFHRASMDEIALRANVAKGTLYYHFKSKSELFKTIVADGLTELMDRVHADLNADLPLEEQIMRIIKHNLDIFLESSGFAHIVFNELSNGLDPEVLEEVRKMRLDYIYFVADSLEQSQRSGVMRDGNCRLAATALIGMIDSGCRYYMNHQNELTREQLEQFMYTTMTTGLFLTTT